jgi:hypothetical protein
MFVRGKIIYSNLELTNEYIGYPNLYEFFKEFISSGFNPMRKVHNTKDHICYIGLSNGGGKLLTIDSDLYENDMFVNPKRIILANVNN